LNPKKIITYADGNPGPGLGQVHICGEACKLIDAKIRPQCEFIVVTGKTKRQTVDFKVLETSFFVKW